MHHNARRNTGGFGTFVQNDIVNGKSIWKHHNDVVVWIVLKSEYFGFSSAVYLGTVYLVPESFSHEHEDLIALMYDQVKCVPANCDYFLCGDLNARTNTSPDNLINEMTGSDGDLKNIVPNEVMSGQHRVKLAMERNALDIQRHSMNIGPVNKRGIQLL